MEEKFRELYADCFYALIGHLREKLKEVKDDKEMFQYFKTMLPMVSSLKKLPTPAWLNSFHENYIKEYGNNEKLTLELRFLIERFDSYASLLKLMCLKYGSGDYHLYFKLLFDIPDEDVIW